MGRKNQRRDEYVPLDLSPDQLPTPPPPRLSTAGFEARQQAEIQLAERQRIARIACGIDWTICIVPGCGKDLMGPFGRLHHSVERRDPEERLPICYEHAAIVWRTVQANQHEPTVIESTAMLRARTAIKDQAREEADRQKRLAVKDGHIYFVRLNGLIKVGWSRDVSDRLRAYGPDVEVLVIYPGSRDDETTLHRQFRPVLARGREWYEDHQILHDYAMKMRREQGGTAIHYDGWTRPKEVIRTRRRR